ncbi:DUF7344 domain-containing protein [Haloarchaeobius amylolyticus]|uniref:DUF7344 domain-containing protein n=1 Tax=Haloarchaeobius amylolyticus TaxID=1198296 RepID=UPI00227101B4|nr:hypothetical protein [Haloarchaeobius amylolyticus]
MSAAVEDTESESEVPPELLPDGTDEFTKDDMFHLLQNRRRRDVLRYLQDTDDPVRMRDIAEQVAAWEHDTTVQRLTSKERQRVYIALYQSHLPALDEEGVIDYNQDRGIVERQPLAEELMPYLDEPAGDEATDESTTGRDHDWTFYYLAATGVASMLFVGTALGVVGLSAELLAIGMLTLFGSLSGADALSSREQTSGSD